MQTIPLNRLALSDSNVRKTPNPEFEEQLSHDIEARGVLQNLIVTRAKKRGHFAVIAGGKRLRAMQLIVERGAWDADHDVPCLVIDESEGDASEVSLAENFQRLAMTPAEECRAFQHFIKEDGDTAAVAKRFGLTQRFVEGRLRLANLAEPIFEALASGDITLDLAKAYAATDQHEVQLRVFEQTRYSYHISADSIRRMIADGAIRGTDALALLVGEDAYVAAGGRIERDLFSEAADDRWPDVAIVHELAGAKMEAEAQRLAGELGIGSIWPVAGTSSWHARSELDLKPVRLPPAPIGEEAQARIDAIEARMNEIGDLIEAAEASDDETVDFEALENEYGDLERECGELSNPPRELPEEWKLEVGRFLILSTKGEMVLEPDYYSEKVLVLEADDDGNITGGSFAAPTSRGGAPKSGKPEATAPGGKPVSARLFDELAVQRRNILAASLLGDPGLALDYAIFALIGSDRYEPRGTTIKAERPSDPVTGEIPSGAAETMLAQAHERLEKGWREAGDVVARFVAFRALDDDAKAAWLAYVVATSLEAKNGYASEYHPIHGLIGSLLDIDVAALWRPTSENFFDRVNKTACLAALKEVGGSELANRYAASKKTELSSSCHRLFAGETIVEEDIKARALAWVPPAMRFTMHGEAGPDYPEGEPGNADFEDGVAGFGEGDPDETFTIDPDVNDDLGAELAGDAGDDDLSRFTEHEDADEEAALEA